jgi:hypothetical protein
MAKKNSHKDVEFHCLGRGGEDVYFNTFDEAAAFALGDAMSTGVWKNFDVLVHSEAGARWWGGEDAVEIYRSDPDASVFERHIIKVQTEGMVH